MITMREKNKLVEGLGRLQDALHNVATSEVLGMLRDAEEGLEPFGDGRSPEGQPYHGVQAAEADGKIMPRRPQPSLLEDLFRAFMKIIISLPKVCQCGNKCQCHNGGHIVSCPPECGNPLGHFGCHCLCPSERCACGGECRCHFMPPYGGVPCPPSCPTRGFDGCHLCYCGSKSGGKKGARGKKP